MCTSLLNPPGQSVTVDGRTRQINPRDINATDVPLGGGMAGEARNAILNRRERLRIAEEGS